MIKKVILATGVSLLPFILPFEAAAAILTKIYVFGDSLSDPGNIFNVTSFVNQFINPSIPIDPPILDPSGPSYSRGRYSDGDIWVDYLAQSLELLAPVPSTSLAVPFPVTFTPPNQLGVNSFFGGATTTQSVNFAFGSAQTGFENATDPRLPGVLQEIAWYKNDLAFAQQSADADALYIIWAGANDYQSGNFNSANEPVNNLKTAVESLHTIGARNFLVPNLPDLGKTPRAIGRGNEESARLTNLTKEHNSLLETTLKDLKTSLMDIDLLASLDVYSLFEDAITNPVKYDLTNVTEACVVGEFPAFSVCNNPEDYLFWDSLHPTTVAHAKVGELAFEAVTVGSEPKPVPEPLSPVSFGVLGLAALLRWKFQKSPHKVA